MIASINKEMLMNKSIYQLKWENLGMVNILTGPNGSGKSAIVKNIYTPNRLLIDTPRYYYKASERVYKTIIDQWITEFTGIPVLYEVTTTGGLIELEKMFSYLVTTINSSIDLILIDDLGHNLHITLQKELLTFIVNKLPNKQFIITTHSPSIIGDRWENVTKISTILTLKQ